MGASFFAEGQRHRFPLMPYEAEEFGWHCGIRYGSAFDIRDTTYSEVKEWCRRTFAPNTYAPFIKSVWFLYERDAMLCRLRWS